MAACRLALGRRAWIACGLGAGLAGVGLPAAPADEARFEVEHALAKRAEGRDPEQALVRADDGLLYGTARGGGQGAGTVFRVGPGGEFGLVHAFRKDGRQGIEPGAALTQAADGALYGTTVSGGGEGFGTVYRVLAGQVEVLHDFSAGDDIGFAVCGPLVRAADGSLYGAASGGGSSGLGTIFRLEPSGALSNVHTFGTATGDGAQPLAGLAAARDGSLYGTTDDGGQYGRGTIYRLAADGRYEVVHSFDPAIEGYGRYPALLEASDGNLYGVTIAGGRFHAGTVYRMSPEGTVTTIHDFAPGEPADVHEAQSPLIQARDGFLYGVAQLGGAFDRGAVYRLALDGSGFAVIHSFSGEDGLFPRGALVEAGDGRLFGGATGRGPQADGLIYAVDPR